MGVGEKLRNMGKNGFRQPTKKELKKAKDKAQKKQQEKAEAFIKEYKELCAKHGLEVDVTGFKEVQPRLYTPALGLKPYESQPAEGEVTEWFKALAENLETRSKCKHVPADEGMKCKKCGLDDEAWHESGTGVTEQYRKEVKKQIAESKKRSDDKKKEYGK